MGIVKIWCVFSYIIIKLKSFVPQIVFYVSKNSVQWIKVDFSIINIIQICLSLDDQQNALEQVIW
jgi:hypothetical protein